MDHIIAGIARTSDPKELEKILMGCAHLDAARLVVITKANQSNVHNDSHLHFIHTRGPDVGHSGGGTGVPGMGGGSISLSSFVGHAPVPHYLHDVAIHQDVAHNYNVAIDEGRSVVTFKASAEEAPAVAETFRGCGLVNVKTLKALKKAAPA
ncbi:MAG: hypothetical protein GIW97_06880 [Candidatus Eremiobacteraeota bacterium]|nr:hypothetical protein [Candidatus Eremiobacteraeota bacterium]